MLNLNFKPMASVCLLGGIFASSYSLAAISGNFLIPLLVFSIFFLTAAKWPDFSIQLLAFFTILSPIAESGFFAENVLWAEFGLLGISTAFVLKKVFSKNSSETKCAFSDFLAAGFFLLSFISFGLQLFENEAIGQYSIRLAVLSFEFLLIYFIGKNFGNSMEFVKKIVDAMIEAAVALSVFGIMLFNLPNHSIQNFFGFQAISSFSRLSFPFFYENSAGLFFAVFFAMSVCLALFSSVAKKRLFYILCCIPLLLALLYTYSRWSWIIALTCIIIALYFKTGQKFAENPNRKIVFKVFLGIALVLLIVLLGLIAVNQLNYNPLVKNSSQSFLERLAVSDNSFEGRLQIWNTTVVGILQNPLFGNGLGSFQNTYFGLLGMDFSGPYNASNTFLQIAIERGLPAAIFIIAFQLLLLIVLLKKIKYAENEKPLIVTLFLIAFAFFAGGFFEFAFYATRNALLFWLVAGISANLIEEKVLPEKFFSKNLLKIKAISWSLIVLSFFLFAWLPFASVQVEKAAIGLNAPIGNQIKNPSFEQGFLGWKECGSFEVLPTTENSRTGSHSMKISNQHPLEKWSCLSTVLGYVVELEPNTVYKFSAFFLIPENSGIAGKFRLALAIANQPECEKKNLTGNCYAILQSDSTIDNFSLTGAWFQKYFIFRTGNGKSYLRPRIETTSDLRGSGTFYVDDFKLEKTN